MREPGREKWIQEEGFWDPFSVQYLILEAFNILSPLSILHSCLSLGAMRLSTRFTRLPVGNLDIWQVIATLTRHHVINLTRFYKVQFILQHRGHVKIIEM